MVSKVEKQVLEKEKNGKKKLLKLILICFLVVIVLAGAGIGLYFYEDGLVYKTVSVEAGIEVNIADLLVKEDVNASFAEKSQEYDTSVPGQYNLVIHTGGFDHPCLLVVEDTISPELEVEPIISGYGESFEPEEFVTRTSDATKLTISYKKQPDYTKDGDQEVTIVATDLGGNTTEKTTTLTIWPVKRELTVEAGSPVPTISDFILDESFASARFMVLLYSEEAQQNQEPQQNQENLEQKTEKKNATEIKGQPVYVEYATTSMGEIEPEPIDMTKIGKYKLAIVIENRNYEVSLKVEDTMAPELTTKNLEGYRIVKRNPEDFVAECKDATEVTYSFKEEPDFYLEGQQTVMIVATDVAGNTAEKEATMNLWVDNEAPVIYGAMDQLVYLGNGISYKSFLSVSDNCPEELVFDIDSSAVNIKAEGVYPVYCTARDAAGNTVSASFTVTVARRMYSEAEVYAMADGILAGIINESMSPTDKAFTIYQYMRSFLRYYDFSDKGSWNQCAGEAMTSRRGDCYSYASVSQALLTRAGIPNVIIGRIPDGDNLHYWNVVDIGDGHGWYHFDTTPRAIDNPTVFLWTDAPLMEYSVTHGNCYNYDHALYAGIQ